VLSANVGVEDIAPLEARLKEAQLSPSPALLTASARPSKPSCPRPGVEDVAPLEARLKEAGIEYTRSMSGRPAIFFRDPGEGLLLFKACCAKYIVGGVAARRWLSAAIFFCDPGEGLLRFRFNGHAKQKPFG